MNRDHLLNWHETFAPLGAARRPLPRPPLGRSFALTEFESEDHTPDEWKSEPPSEPGWYVVATENNLIANHWRGYWDGMLWVEVFGLLDPDYHEIIPADKSALVRWSRHWA